MPNEADVPTLERPLYLLTFFTPQQPAWTLSNLAAASGLPRTSCLRAIRALEKYQFLRRERHEYRLGAQFIQLGTFVQDASPSRRIATPHLEQLRVETRVTVTWAALEGATAYYTDVLPSPHGAPADVHTGATVSLTSGASGRVLAAFGPQEVRRALIGQLTSLAPHEARQFETLDGLTRKTWLALDFAAGAPAWGTLAAPVFRTNGAFAAAIGLVVNPRGYSSRAALASDLQHLTRTARMISRDLGYVREWQADVNFFLQIVQTMQLIDIEDESAVGADLINYPP